MLLGWRRRRVVGNRKTLHFKYDFTDKKMCAKIWAEADVLPTFLVLVPSFMEDQISIEKRFSFDHSISSDHFDHSISFFTITITIFISMNCND